MNAPVEVNKKELVRNILADILEIDAAELTDEGSFSDEYGADSLRAVEILATLEKEFAVKIPEAELANMGNFRQVIEVLGRYGW
jgi:acyl carrier protein